MRSRYRKEHRRSEIEAGVVYEGQDLEVFTCQHATFDDGLDNLVRQLLELVGYVCHVDNVCQQQIGGFGDLHTIRGRALQRYFKIS